MEKTGNQEPAFSRLSSSGYPGTSCKGFISKLSSFLRTPQGENLSLSALGVASRNWRRSPEGWRYFVSLGKVHFPFPNNFAAIEGPFSPALWLEKGSS